MHELSIPVAGSIAKVKKASEATGGDVGATLGGAGDGCVGSWKESRLRRQHC